MKKKFYTLSPEQQRLLAPLYSLASTPEEEAVLAAICPPMAVALQSLLKKFTQFSLPLFCMFDILWQCCPENKFYSLLCSTLSKNGPKLPKILKI